MDIGMVFLNVVLPLTLDVMAANKPEPVQVAQARAYIVSEEWNGNTKNCTYSNGFILTIAAFAACPTSVPSKY